MSFFQYLVDKLGVPLIGLFVFSKAIRAWREGKTWGILVAILTGALILWFLLSPETVLKAPAALFNKFLEIFK